MVNASELNHAARKELVRSVMRSRRHGRGFSVACVSGKWHRDSRVLRKAVNALPLPTDHRLPWAGAGSPRACSDLARMMHRLRGTFFFCLFTTVAAAAAATLPPCVCFDHE